MWLCEGINIKSYRPVKVHPHISLDLARLPQACAKTHTAHSAQHFVGFLKKMMKDECRRCLFKIKGAKHKTLDLSRSYVLTTPKFI